MFWRLLDACESSGCRFPNRAATLLVDDRARPIGARVRARLQAELPEGFRIHDGALESGYYAGLRLLFGADDASGTHVNLADTGLFDWIASLAADRRLRFVASGLGLPLLTRLFGA